MRTPFSLPVDAILLLGPTGSGKSPLGDHIAEHGLVGRRSCHLDFGNELRAIAAGGPSASLFSPEDLAFINGVLEQGLLLENEQFSLARRIILSALDRCSFRDGDLLVLNGIPRHAGQAQDVAALARVHAVVVLECSAEAVFCRLRDNVGGDRTDRSDDHRDLVKKKINTFSERTAPLVRHYERSGALVYRIAMTDRTTTADAYAVLASLASANPPVPLVAEPPQGGVGL